MRISIVAVISDPQYRNLLKENLLGLDIDGHQCELIIAIDNNQIGFSEEEKAELGKYLGVFTVNTANLPPVKDPQTVRDRITNIRNVSRGTISDTEMVFSFEQDTVLPNDALLTLLDAWQATGTVDTPPTGLISGVQVARHGKKILGAWRANDFQFPTEVTSLGMDELEGITKVDGTGMFCYLTPTHLYKEATYGWREPVGPDAWYGFYLRIKGYQNYVDQRVICPHKVIGKREELMLTPDNTEVKKIRFFNNNDTWNHEFVK